MPTSPVHHLDVDHGSIAYAWINEPGEQPLVMLHGLGDSSTLTFPTMITSGPLREHSILLVDLPGFGTSRFDPDHPATIKRYADDVFTLLDHLHFDAIDLFGHSMGGNIAIEIANRNPHRIQNLVVAEPLLEAEQSILAADIASVTEEAFVTRRIHLLQRATGLQAHRGDVAAASFQHTLALASPVAMHRAATSLIYDAAPVTLSHLLALPMPRTVVVGERTKADTSVLTSNGVRVAIIPHAGHFMVVESGFRTNCAILGGIA